MYEQLPAVLREDLDDADLAAAELDERKARQIYGASQWQLMWRKFIRNKVALFGGVIVLLYYLSAVLAGFLAPYTLTTRFGQYIYLPPQRVYIFDGGAVQPFVYDVTMAFDEDLRRVFEVNYDKKIPLQFFEKGESYSILGLVEWDNPSVPGARRYRFDSWHGPAGT